MRRAAARTAPRFLFHPNDKQDHAAAESHPALKTATVPRRERPAALFPNLCFAALGVSLPFWPCTVSYKDCRSPGRTSSCHRRGLQGALPTAPPGTHQDRLLMPLFFFSANLSALDRVLPLLPRLAWRNVWSRTTRRHPRFRLDGDPEETTSPMHLAAFAASP